MAENLVRAYLDDYHDIEVVIDKQFCQGKSDVFYLSDGQEIFPLQLQKKEEQQQ